MYTHKLGHTSLNTHVQYNQPLTFQQVHVNKPYGNQVPSTVHPFPWCSCDQYTYLHLVEPCNPIAATEGCRVPLHLTKTCLESNSRGLSRMGLWPLQCWVTLRGVLIAPLDASHSMTSAEVCQHEKVWVTWIVFEIILSLYLCIILCKGRRDENNVHRYPRDSLPSLSEGLSNVFQLLDHRASPVCSKQGKPSLTPVTRHCCNCAL